ncbi:MAG: ATP-binding protein [Erysipelotrichaceae bacterium]|nr:ATP-binding protein [Erysipelotrichaceae bacterium]
MWEVNFMFSLMKIKVSGYRMLKDEFEINFISKSRVNSDDEEIIEIDSNLYTFNIMAFTGGNSSGKSTTLELIAKVIELMKTGRWVYRKFDFESDKINLYLEFYKDGYIYKYDSNILPLEDIDSFEIENPYCKIVNEKISKAKYSSNVGKRYNRELNFVETFEQDLKIEDTSKLLFICKDSVTGYNIKPFSNNIRYINNNFFESLNKFNDKLTFSIIQLLDEGIEYINYISRDTIALKRYNKVEKIVTRRELISQLSNGTLKGIELYISIVNLLKTGGAMIIDEIENCFHKNLVNNILFLLTDKTINKNNAQLFFSTHYVEILDVFERRDNIYILHKENNEINIKNLYSDYEIRTELSKSKQFNNNTFNTLLNYVKLMEVRRLIKNEISNSN